MMLKFKKKIIFGKPKSKDMKKYFSTLIVLGFVLCTSAQEATKTKPSIYAATGLSISNSYDTTFAYSSYPSIEVGLMKNNFSLGLVAGRSNLSGFKHDAANNYWYELKSAVSFPIGKLSGYGLLGIGNYMTTQRFFVEYGVGFSYSFNKWSVFSQASNWDGTWYVTPGLCYTF